MHSSREDASFRCCEKFSTMATTHSVRVEALSKENYDTWKVQIKFLLIRNETWKYVNGTKAQPPENATNDDKTAWEEADLKAQSDLVLSINPSEIKQIKGCNTSREIWLKLESIYQSKRPARKATLLKQLILHRMLDGDDIRDHTARFFDAVDKLEEMEIEINKDLLSILLLYSLPMSYESFRIAIKSRDELPTPEALKIKFVEESDARNSKVLDGIENAMWANNGKYKHKNQWKPGNSSRENHEEKYQSLGKNEKPFKFKCHKCRKIGHKAVDCREKQNPETEKAGHVEEICHLVSSEEQSY